MATQSASLISVTRPQASGMINAIATSPTFNVVSDPYSSKYYGSESYEAVVSNQQALRSYYSNIVSQAEVQAARPFGMSTWGETNLNIAAPQTNWGMSSLGQPRSTLSPADEARQMLASLSNDITKDNYVQKPQMIESFNANPDGWNKYFESSYKTPRLAEDNAQAAQQNAKSNQGGRATGNQQLVSSNLEIRKEVGTGVGKESVGLNPFGKLDAGLNI